MLNNLDTYAEAGRRAEEARRHHDEGCAQFHGRWVMKAVKREAPEDRGAAMAAYEAAYEREGENE